MTRYWLGRRLALGLAALLMALPARAIVELDSSFGVTDAEYQANAAAYPSVGEFTGADDSGVLVGTDWVLTAAHVAETLSDGSSLFVVGGNTFTVEETIINPNYNSSTLDADIALVKLSGNVTNVTPAVLYSGSSELGLTATWVGFGQSGTGITGADTPRGIARGATNVIDAFYDPTTGDASQTDGTTILADFDDGTGFPGGNNTLGEPPFPLSWSSATPTQYEGSLAPGDSGGGVFATISSTVVLVGVNDFVSAGNNGSTTQYGAISGATRVSSYVSWIDTTVPEPGATAAVMGLLAGVAAGVYRRGRRRVEA
jgi:secreted trypsin-like serine protease